MLKNVGVIAAKIQTDASTPAVPTASADAFLCKNIGHTYEGARMYDREVVKNTIGKLKPLFGGTLFGITFEVEVKGSTGAGVAPEWGPVIRACKVKETIVASTSVTYALRTSSPEYCTIYYWEDGLEYQITGCQGSVDFNFAVGKPGIMSFTMVGHLANMKPADVVVPTPTYDALVPRVLLGVGLTLDSNTPVISALSFGLGNELANVEDISAADGYGIIQITGRDVKGSIDPLATLVADYDWVGKWITDNEAALDTGVVGTVAGNKYQLTMPAVSYMEIGNGDRDKVLSRDVGLSINESSGDDEFSLAFT